MKYARYKCKICSSPLTETDEDCPNCEELEDDLRLKDDRITELLDENIELSDQVNELENEEVDTMELEDIVREQEELSDRLIHAIHNI